MPSPTSETVRREITVTEATAAVASRQREQQQLAGSCRTPSSSRIAATNFSVPHSAVHIDRSLSPRLAPFPPRQRRGVRGAAGVDGGGRALALVGFRMRILASTRGKG